MKPERLRTASWVAHADEPRLFSAILLFSTRRCIAEKILIPQLGYRGGRMIGAISLLAAFVVFILAHEAGHFFAAKALGIKVSEFFVGFGPRIWSTQRGETEYGLKAIPAGGYVRIVGMSVLEEVDPEDMGRTYREKPFWQKSVVVLKPVRNAFKVQFNAQSFMKVALHLFQ